MRLQRIVLRLVRLPLVRPFETSFGQATHQETVLVEVVDRRGASGFGECPTGPAPAFSGEWAQGALEVLHRFLAPALLAAGEFSPEQCPVLLRKVRGHPMAKAGLEAACWDSEAVRRGVPLAEAYAGIGGSRVRHRSRVAAGISLGIEPTVDALLSRVDAAVRRGYQRIKLKVKPGWDVAVVAWVRNAFPKTPLMVDANAAYTLRDAAHLRRLDRFGLMMIEQPLGIDDLIDHAALQRRLKTPICLDESIRGLADARAALRWGSCRIINLKPARVGGPTRAREIHDLCRRERVPLWCGGLLETGVGRLHNIALASLPGFTLPGDISESARYFPEDLIDPPVVLEPGGWIPVPGPGAVADRIVRSRLRKATVAVKVVARG